MVFSDDGHYADVSASSFQRTVSRYRHASLSLMLARMSGTRWQRSGVSEKKAAAKVRGSIFLPTREKGKPVLDNAVEHRSGKCVTFFKGAT